MKKNFLFKLLIPLLVFILNYQESTAQLIFNGQVRTRTEYRDGQGTLPEGHLTPSFFTSQRTRLNLGYNSEHWKLFSSIQDVRVWGMDASTISNLEGNKLFLHEGWGELIFNDTLYLKKIKNLSLKIGRQEIAYDDERLLGSLGWLQQSRRHDAAILKFAHGAWTADIGVAFNQNREKKNAGNLYAGVPLNQIGTDSANIATPAGTNFITNMYKSMQYLYVSKEFGFTKATFLFFKDDFQKPGSTSVRPVKGTNCRVTVGGNIFATLMRKHKIDATFYYQGNKDRTGKTMDAYMAALSTQFLLGRKFTTGPGAEYLSGENTTKATNVNHRFDPLYGTPHKFWGYMDYFYVADPYGVNGNNNLSPGLVNFYWKSRYKLRDNLTAALDIHEFYAGNKVIDVVNPTETLNKRLGTELDFVLTYNMTKNVSIEGGYSIMLATTTMGKLKRAGTQTASALANVPYIDKRNNGNWAYLMITIRPDFLFQINDKLKMLDALKKDVDQLKAK
jgi:hypothetical protein